MSAPTTEAPVAEAPVAQIPVAQPQEAPVAAAPPAVPSVPMPSFAFAFSAPEQVGPPKSIMIYGEPGTWKTSIAGSYIKVPGVKRILYIDVDNGTEVFVNDPEIQAAVLDGRIQILQIDKLHPQAFDMIDAAVKEILSQDFGYDAVVLDAMDVVQEIAVERFMATTFNDKGKLDSRAAWGEVSKWVSNIMWGLQNTTYFTGITVVHSKTEEEKTGATTIKPKFQGSIKDNVAGIPSLVAYVGFEKNAEGKVELVAGLGKSDEYISKSRYSAKVPDRIPNFDLPKLYALINSPAAPAVEAPTPAAAAA
jgi:hypothetical protein